MGKIGNSRKNAILIGYITVGMQSLSSIILTKLYLAYLGQNMYGIYQMVFSIAQYILLFDFGISTTVVRFRTFALENNDKKADENLLWHCAVILTVLSTVIVVVGSIVYRNLGFIYSSLNGAELTLAKNMLVIMILQIIMTLVEHYFQGIALSEEKYTVVKLLAFIKTTAKLILVAVLILSGFGIMTVVYIDCSLTIIFMGFIIAYDRIKIPFKVKFNGFDAELSRNIGFLMLALLLQSLATYANNWADKTILGIMLTSQAVAVYSVAMTISSFFASIPNSMNSVYVPKATQMVAHNATGEEFTDLVIKPGRVQFMFCGAVVAGFGLFGREFIRLWVGKESIDAWAVAMILIVPQLFPLVQNVCLSILTAMNKRMFRSVTVVSTTVLNIIVTVLLVERYGMIGAPIGTAVSILLGNVLATNIYYHKYIHLNVIRMYKGIFGRTTLCIAIASALSALTLLLPTGGWLGFLIRCGVFSLIYVLSLWFYGANDFEKGLIRGVFNRFSAKMH